jgi:outer membrane protein
MRGDDRSGEELGRRSWDFGRELLRLGVCLSIFLPCLAQAVESQPKWEFGLGAAAVSLPHYRGSDQTRAWALPVPYFIYRGEVLKSDREGTRARLLRGANWAVEFSGSANPPSEEENRARAGMPVLPATLEMGPKLSWRLWDGGGNGWRVKAQVPLRAVVGVQRSPGVLGATLEPTLNADRALGSGNLGLVWGGVWGSRGWHRHLYGVEPVYARSGRPAHEAAGGYAGWQMTAAASRRWGRAWMGAYLRYDRIAGSPMDSPLVKRASNTSLGLGFAWELGRSAEVVTPSP